MGFSGKRTVTDKFRLASRTPVGLEKCSVVQSTLTSAIGARPAGRLGHVAIFSLSSTRNTILGEAGTAAASGSITERRLWLPLDSITGRGAEGREVCGVLNPDSNQLESAPLSIFSFKSHRLPEGQGNI